jgi:hypothetical protein
MWKDERGNIVVGMPAPIGGTFSDVILVNPLPFRPFGAALKKKKAFYNTSVGIKPTKTEVQKPKSSFDGDYEQNQPLETIETQTNTKAKTETEQMAEFDIKVYNKDLKFKISAVSLIIAFIILIFLILK